MKKIFTVFIFILCLCLPLANNFSIIYAESENVKVVVEECSLYINVEEIDNKINLSFEDCEKIDLAFGEELTLLSQEIVEMISDDFNFYYVSISKNGEDYEGYVITTFVMPSENVALAKTLDPNAKVLYKDTIIYASKDANNELKLGEETIKLKQQQDVKILDGYDKNKEFHEIMFEIDGVIYTGYIKTADLLVEGFNGIIILIVFIFILVASIAISIVLTTKKKRKGKINKKISKAKKAEEKENK